MFSVLSECDPVVRNANPQAPLVSESETLGIGPRDASINKPSW